MSGVKEVRQLDDKRLHWHAEIAGVDREWDAEIVHQEPDDRIAWRATEGAQNDGTVSFQSIGADEAQVSLRLEFDPEGLVEKAGDATKVVEMQVQRDLENFKEFIENREAETGAWRGSVKPTGDVDPGPEQSTI
jgi:uncharacterized membrane protein